MKSIIRLLVSLPAIALATAGAFLLTSCAHLSVKTKSWSMSATSVCKDIQVPSVSISNNNVQVEGYKSNVSATGADAAGTVIGTAVKTAVK